MRFPRATYLPLNRQSEIYAREGVDLERSTLADWVGSASKLLEPLNEALRKHVMSAEKLHADDTPVPVLEPGKGRTRTGRLWTYVRDERSAGQETAPAAWFAYTPDRSGKHPMQHLAAFKGTLQADAYAGFNRLYDSGDVKEAALFGVKYFFAWRQSFFPSPHVDCLPEGTNVSGLKLSY